MRTEMEMLNLILNTAMNDERIRAVIMNGSRANPNAKRDPFQDFDIVYYVTDITPFVHNLEWIKRFGEIMIMQTPIDESPLAANDFRFTYLMQFMDGNRIDLNIFDLSKREEIGYDSLSVLLLDKDGIIPSLPPANESDYLPTPPNAESYYDCCNEFWWVSIYVAKGLWRKEITYSKGMMDQVMREKLLQMLSWYAGFSIGFTGNTGKHGKNLINYLEPPLWKELMCTYSDAEIENTWCALEASCVLFRRTAMSIAERFGFEYPCHEDERVSEYLEHIRFLPEDAKEIY